MSPDHHVTDAECESKREACVSSQTEKLSSVKARLSVLVMVFMAILALAAFGWTTRAADDDLKAVEARVQRLESMAATNRAKLDAIEKNTDRILDKLK